MEEIRKIVRQVIKEEFEKEERYVATMEFYVWAKSDQEAVSHAKSLSQEMDMKLDNQAAIVSLVKQPHGTLGNTPVEIT